MFLIQNLVYLVVNKFIKNSKYKKMGKENHHGTYRLDHINRVAKMTYNVSKFLKSRFVTLAPPNIEDIFVTLLVLKFPKFNVVTFEPANI